MGCQHTDEPTFEQPVRANGLFVEIWQRIPMPDYQHFGQFYAVFAKRKYRDLWIPRASLFAPGHSASHHGPDGSVGLRPAGG